MIHHVFFNKINDKKGIDAADRASLKKNGCSVKPETDIVNPVSSKKPFLPKNRFENTRNTKV